MSVRVSRPADSRCGHPSDPMLDIPQSFVSLDHKLGYYLSTYCEHGLGEGRSEPSQCRVTCKVCHAPCACSCHGGQQVPFEGFSLAAEDELRATIRRVVREMGVAPEGPRGVELVSDILSGVFLEIDRDGLDGPGFKP